MSDNLIRFLLSKEYLNINDIHNILLFFKISLSMEDTRRIIIDICMFGDSLEEDPKVLNPDDNLNMVLFPTQNFLLRFHMIENLKEYSDLAPWTIKECLGEYKKLTPNKYLVKEYLSKDTLNLEELALIFRYFDISYNSTDVYQSLQSYNIHIEENVYIYEIDTKDFIECYSNILDLKPFINSDNSTFSSYIYSEALKPYNDIILAFDSEYQKLKGHVLAKQIKSWLQESYKDLKDHDIRVLNNLIQTHYKIKK